MAKTISPNNLIKYLDNNFKGPVLIKVFSDEKYAKSFSDGKLCLGTVEYYRNKYEQDGRGDSGDSVAVYPIVFGVSEKGRPFDIQNVYATQTNILTALIYCLMEYDHTEVSQNRLIQYFNQEENLGSFLCILENREEFNEQLKNINFVAIIEGDVFEPVIRQPYLCNKVEYVDKPDSMGFQKRNIQKYMLQQEFRYAFNFNVNGLNQSQKGQLKSTCLFDVKKSIACTIFKVAN